MNADDREPRLEWIETLRAPRRTPRRRRQLRDRIVSAALPLLQQRQGRGPWQLLEAWARPGLVAALIMLAVLTGALRFQARGQGEVLAPVALEDALRGPNGGALPEWLVATDEPGAVTLLESALLEPSSDGNR